MFSIHATFFDHHDWRDLGSIFPHFRFKMEDCIRIGHRNEKGFWQRVVYE